MSAVSRKRKRSRAAGARGRFWLPVAAGGLLLLVGLVFTTTRGGAPQPAGEPAPDITLNTLQGSYQLSQRRGELVALYFSFVG